MAKDALTNSTEAELLNFLVHQQVPTPFDLYLGALSTDPGETGAGVELAGNGYARVQLNPSDFTSPIANTYPLTGSYCVNTNEVTLPEATGAWAAITHIEFWDEMTGGTMKMKKELVPNRTLSEAGEQLTFPPGKLKISID